MPHEVSVFATLTQQYEISYTVDTLPENWLAMNDYEKHAWLEKNAEWDNTESIGSAETESVDKVWWDE